MTSEEIKAIALANGFELKKQNSFMIMDLNEYVYDFARALIADQQAQIDTLDRSLRSLQIEANNLAMDHEDLFQLLSVLSSLLSKGFITVNTGFNVNIKMTNLKAAHAMHRVIIKVMERGE